MDNCKNSSGVSPQSPRISANFVNKLFFWWLKPLFHLGKTRDLKSNDLYDTLPVDRSEQLGSRLEKYWKNEVENARQSNKKPKLVNAIRKTFGWSYFYYAGHMLVLNCLRVLQPFMLGLLVEYFERGSKTTRSQAFVYASSLILLTFVHSLLKHHIDASTLEIGMRLRIACSSLIYRKSLKLSNASVSSNTGGQMINLLSNDVVRFDPLFMYLHYIWITPLQVSLIAYLIWRNVQLASLVGVLLMTLGTIPVQAYIGKVTSRLRKKIATRTDERVGIMNEIINGIYVIKTYTWEKPFEHLISIARRNEIDVITSMSYVRGVNTASNAFVDRTCLYFTILVYVIVGNAISANMIFSMVPYFTILQNFLVYNYPRAISNAAEAHVSIKRIEKFLMLEEIRIMAPLLSIEDNGSIILKKITASWSTNTIANTLHEITMQISPKKLHAIVGPVGCGKTSLLNVILGELRPSSGEIKINGTISYAPQRAWLFPGTIRDNVLFDQQYSEERYREVLRVCSLERDLELLPLGDLSRVADRGTNLSGGQCTRINLARAVYRNADIYLFDDLLSAVDANISKCLFNNCINGYLKDKTRIFVTHQIQHLKEADLIFLVNNGRLESCGKFHDFSDKELQSLNASSNDEESESRTRSLERIKNKKNVENRDLFKSSKSNQNEESKETQELLAEGKMQSSIFSRYFKSGNSQLLLVLTILFFIVAQSIRSISDYWLSYWAEWEESRSSSYKISLGILSTPQFDNLTGNSRLSRSIDLFDSIQTSSSSPSPAMPQNTTKSSILDLVSSTMKLDIFTTEATQSMLDKSTEEILLNATTTFLSTTERSIISNDTKGLEPNTVMGLSSHLNTNLALIIYGCILMLCVITAISKCLLFYKICMNASRSIHNEMFSCVLRASMRFFNQHSSGQILNRFSKDTGSMDEILPTTMIESIEIFSVILGVVVQVLFINWWSILPMILTGSLYWKIQTFYVPTAYKIKRLEGAAKSPVLSYVTSSIEGLVAIRSARAQSTVCRRFDSRQDEHTRTHSLSISIASAFGLWLDLTSVVLVAFVTFGCLFADSSIHASTVGLAITQILMLCGMMQRGIRQLAETVTQMTSVERILQFTELDQEEDDYCSAALAKPPKAWPSHGKIEFSDFSLRYSDDQEPVLNNINLMIESGSKIGIVGRTGAGKSSLISALFRLAPAEGKLLIDDLDTASVGLRELRNRISIIPQEPVLFSATLRDNLDPSHEFEDERLWAALEDVQLNKTFAPLELPIECGGKNLSGGQRQLLCLARAIVKRSRVLVLDEATANLDPTTEALIRETIDTKFAECTVLHVAHRLESVIGSDRVLVVDEGRIAEFDRPQALLQRQDSALTKLANSTGEETLQQLRKLAATAADGSAGMTKKSVETELKDEEEATTPAADEPKMPSVNGLVKSGDIAIEDVETVQEHNEQLGVIH
ncbi:hypothetical protein QAD02_020011 [Eretmocerus hayati]|uniref:Uncharacterized protein n=1 Tax=Eretmocerus hayati TaxID=131215 RepID=A0ACC2PKV9_9HYME|nr:hypothetical protein QAD02_020011 [Eretmocerus hayati]